MSTTGRTDGEQAVMPPPGHARFALFDGLRAIAALSVLVFHAAHVADTASGHEADTWLESIGAGLPIGVTFFFLAPGFLLYPPFVAGRLEGGGVPPVRDFPRRGKTGRAS